MKRTTPVNSHDPTARPAADQSAQSAGGLRAGRHRMNVVRSGDWEDELVNRRAPNFTPRRYEQPIEEDDN